MTVDQIDQRDLTTMTLDELGEEVMQQRHAAEVSLATALGHFVRIGVVLLHARERVPDEEWDSWCELHGMSKTSSNRAMRLAYYRDELPPEAWQPSVNRAGRLVNPTATRAEVYLRGLPPVRPKGFRYEQGVVDEARRLKAAGVPQVDICELLGLSAATVSVMVRPGAQAEYARKHRRRYAARRLTEREAARALAEKREREERDRLAKATGGELSKSYGLIRQALAALDKVATEPSVEATRHLHRAEESVVEAMRAERGASRDA